MDPRVSVITVSFNQAPFLEQTLQSVLAQRDQLHEYLVLDGGSTDGSTEILKKYGDRLDYWHSRKDTGQSDAIHQGFSLATGDLLCWVNSDDLLLPGAIHAVRGAFAAQPALDIVTGWHVSVDRDSRVIGVHRNPAESPQVAAWGVLHVCQPSTYFRRRLYHALGGLDLSLHCVMDTELWLRMLEIGANFGHVPRFLSAFRKHELSKGGSWHEQYASERLTLARKFPQYLGSGPRLRAGRIAHRATQLASGRYVRDWMSTRAWAGRNVGEVFGG